MTASTGFNAAAVPPPRFALDRPRPPRRRPPRRRRRLGRVAAPVPAAPLDAGAAPFFRAGRVSPTLGLRPARPADPPRRGTSITHLGLAARAPSRPTMSGTSITHLGLAARAPSRPTTRGTSITHLGLSALHSCGSPTQRGAPPPAAAAVNPTRGVDGLTVIRHDLPFVYASGTVVSQLPTLRPSSRIRLSAVRGVVRYRSRSIDEDGAPAAPATAGKDPPGVPSGGSREAACPDRP